MKVVPGPRSSDRHEQPSAKEEGEEFLKGDFTLTPVFLLSKVPTRPLPFGALPLAAEKPFCSPGPRGVVL